MSELVLMKNYEYIAREGQRAIHYENHFKAMKDQKWSKSIELDLQNYVRQNFPYGHGEDRWKDFTLVAARSNKIVFEWKFLFNNGTKDIYKDYTGVVLPLLDRHITLKILGSNREEVKSYMSEVIEEWLLQPIPERMADEYDSYHKNEKAFLNED